MSQKEILNLMEEREVWTYVDIAEATGIKTINLCSPLNRLAISGKIIKRTNGKKAFFSLKKHVDALNRKVDFDTLSEDYKMFVAHSKRYDQCFARYMKGNHV